MKSLLPRLIVRVALIVTLPWACAIRGVDPLDPGWGNIVFATKDASRVAAVERLTLTNPTPSRRG